MFWKKKNTRFTKKETILDQMAERRPLPLSTDEFEEWSDRIISGALIPGATAESQKFALANMILHLGPTESHKEDAFFIHTLRKTAVNQIADAKRHEIRDKAKERLAREEEARKKLEIEKRYEDMMAKWNDSDRAAFIHARYLEENKVLPINSAATPNIGIDSGAGVANAKPEEKSPPTANA